MSKNCLVTALKGTVDNPNLNKLGEILVPVAAGQSISVTKRFFTTTPVVRVVSGNSTVTDTTTDINVTAVTDSVVGITSKYNMTQVELNATNDWNIDTEVLKYSPLIWLGVTNTNLIHGDIKYLYKQGNIQTTVNIGSPSMLPNIYGDIVVLGNCLSATTFTLRYSSKIYGVLEDVVAKFVVNGKTTGSINVLLPIALGNFKFNSNNVSTPGTGTTLSWEPSGANTSISFGDVTTVITVNADGTWVRVS